MPVLKASDGMKIAPNGVYIAPSNRYLSVLHATLHELETPPAESLQFPIDVFFRALAEDQQERAVGIVLSGTGTDGTLGLQEQFKEAAGITMVQNVQSARYDGMPRSALATHLVDYVLPPSDMPTQLIAAVQKSSLPRTAPKRSPTPYHPRYYSGSFSCCAVTPVTISPAIKPPPLPDVWHGG